MYPFTPYPLTPIGSLIGFVLSVLPLVSRLRFQPWNTGIWMYAFWIGIMNFTNFVNTIIWHNNVDIVVPVWCDIGKSEIVILKAIAHYAPPVSKLQLGAGVGVPACSLVLSLHLFKITRMRAVVLVDEKAQVHASHLHVFCHLILKLNSMQRRRALIFDLALTLGIPGLITVLCMCQLYESMF